MTSEYEPDEAWDLWGKFLDKCMDMLEDADLEYHDCDTGPDEVWINEGACINEGFEWLRHGKQWRSRGGQNSKRQR